MHAMLWILSLALIPKAPALVEGTYVRQVTVSGTATTEVTPDLMVWHLAVKNKNAQLPAVAEEHSKAVAQVLDFLTRTGIKQEVVQTAQMEFGENWEYRNNSRVMDGSTLR